jgi:hypothetical protein
MLQLKAMGKNPQELLDAYTPTMEMLDWLMQANAQWFDIGSIAVGTSTSIGTAFSPTAITVPSLEAWYVHSFTIATAALVAGDNVRTLAPVLAEVVGGTLRVAKLSDGPETPIGLSGANNIAFASARKFFAMPGQSLRVAFGLTAATTITISGYVRYTRLPL